MGRADFVKHGSWNVICDRCGMKRKASDCRITWDNLFVCQGCWTPRHPQDFVKGIPDNQTVPISRPDTVSTMGATTVATTALKNATTIVLTSVTGIADGDAIGIVLDNGDYHWTFSDGDPSGSTVTLGSYLPYLSTSGNAVYIASINNETYLTATGLTATGL